MASRTCSDRASRPAGGSSALSAPLCAERSRRPAARGQRRDKLPRRSSPRAPSARAAGVAAHPSRGSSAPAHQPPRAEHAGPPRERQCGPRVRRSERTPGTGEAQASASRREDRSVAPRPPIVGPGRLSNSIPAPPICATTKGGIPVRCGMPRGWTARAAAIATARTGQTASGTPQLGICGSRTLFTAAQAKFPETARRGDLSRRTLRPAACRWFPGPELRVVRSRDCAPPRHPRAGSRERGGSAGIGVTSPPS